MKMKRLLGGIAVLSMCLLAGTCKAEARTVDKVHTDVTGVFIVQFDYDDAILSTPATSPPGPPHYSAKITVRRVTDTGITELVCPPWLGVFTDGKCWEDNLTAIVLMAKKAANPKLRVGGETI